MQSSPSFVVGASIFKNGALLNILIPAGLLTHMVLSELKSIPVILYSSGYGGNFGNVMESLSKIPMVCLFMHSHIFLSGDIVRVFILFSEWPVCISIV